MAKIRTTRSGTPLVCIIGAKKAATTSLFTWLAAAPEINPSGTKELHYFSHVTQGDRDWYLSHFDRHAVGRLLLEASPYYLFHPSAAMHCAENFENVKAIAVLRDPVERAYSDYQQSVRRGREKLSFEEAIEVEPRRLAGEEEKLKRDPGYSSFSHRSYGYFSRGIYAPQIERWRAAIGAENVLVCDFHRLTRGDRKSALEVLSFLSISRAYADKAIGSANTQRYPPLAGATRRRLRRAYQSSDEELSSLTGVHFSWMKEQK
ncbi:sulfotransferase domain-containing protein [Paractinoplanes rishiriensis]|uniref:Sulfotransferase domain-containing protein n=1 Tax=Paractinoplanes rishiriensis TaxID=1050105 RepID=A0A919MTQ0_9ACTN|nr:sulfotransferase domain-containing protein [Actinoplanes rishiriensis]GIE99486.1 hypothetical protein Ari01nite_69510 [Actinoplanes rishiriensis]